MLHKISEVDNVNKYFFNLILEDFYGNRKYHFINNDIEIDFEVSKTMQDLIKQAEVADILDDYGLYMNLADAIDSQGKKKPRITSYARVSGKNLQADIAYDEND